MTNKKAGLYVHFPFCNSKCDYCDFFSLANSTKFFSEYFRSLKKELYSKENPKMSVDTVFFGGGNPGLIPENEIQTILETIKNSFNVSDRAEISLEINPEEISPEKLKFLKLAGVNRLSIGVQSFNSNFLKILGRDFSGNSLSKIEMVENYFENINLDFIYGIPNQSLQDIKNELSLISDFIKHLSFYELTIEEKTPLARKIQDENISLKTEDEILEMQCLIETEIKKKGFRKYEISNFSKQGFECRHNLHYWSYDNYLGVGPGAVGTIDGVRYENTKNLDQYFSGKFLDKEYPLSKNEQEQEYIMMNLRKVEGINFRDYQKRFGKKFQDTYSGPISEYRKFFSISRGNLFLNDKGLGLHNEVVARLS